jgi:hypothetical protein
MIITLILLSGEELVAQLVSEDAAEIVVKKPLRIEYAEIENTMATRLNRFMTLDDGESITIYKRQVVATSTCAQKMVDYYTKAVDKCYSDTYREVSDFKQGLDAGITADELMSLMTGRTKIQ